ncbi:hypothetical protein [Aeoliella sp. SH292]|uniref:hypothetical protein n=1 Tax=Aeoliella sp. SH292 TaxID=3454464 RepID=UPI003F95FDD4
MNPEAMAFINGGASETTGDPRGQRPKPVEKAIDVSLKNTNSILSESDGPQQSSTSRRRRQGKEASHPTDRDILDEVLVPLTTRLPHRLVQMLRRRCLEQQIQHAKPDSIQEIVEAALVGWLAKQ